MSAIAPRCPEMASRRRRPAPGSRADACLTLFLRASSIQAWMGMIGLTAVLCAAGPAGAADEPAAAPPGTTGGVARAEAVLKQLEQGMADVKTVQAEFVEEKELKILSRKMTIEGRMALENPGRFAWHVTRPVKYSMSMADGKLRQWDEDTRKVQTIEMSSNPAFQVVTQQLRNWFSGHYADLAGEYAVAVLTNQPAMVIQFVPRPEAPAARFIRSVTVTFQEDRRYVKAIVISDSTGDITRIRFEKTVLNEPIPNREWEVEPRD